MKVQFIFITAFSLLFGCGKKNSPEPNNIQSQIPKSSLGGPVVYVSGWEGEDKDRKALYWKNGKRVELPSKGNTRAMDIAVSGNDVYVAGVQNDRAIYWKNGVEHLLPESNSEARSIFVVNNDVHVTGFLINPTGQTTVAYWKNGTPSLNFASGASVSSQGAQIRVEGNDVYISGYQNFGGSTQNVLTLWKNFEAIALTQDEILPASSSGLAVSGEDVHIAAHFSNPVTQTTVPFYLKNKSKKLLSDGSNITLLTGLFLDGNDVYISGYLNSTPAKGLCWKNGVRDDNISFQLPGGTSGISVNNGSIFISGFESNTSDKTVAKYWKDGVPKVLTDGKFNARATNIFVKK